MAERDPMDVLRDLGARQRAAIAPPEHLRVELGGSTRRGRLLAWIRRVARRRRGTFIIVVALGFGGGLATAAWLSSQPDAPEAGVSCRAAADVDSDQAALGIVDDPLAACAALWEAGDLPGPADMPLGPRVDVRPTGPQAVPPLTACIGRGGLIEVYPAPDGICEELGLRRADLTPTPEVAAITELTVRLGEDLDNADCRDEDAAVALVEGLLAELGLDDWSIRVQPDLDRPTCAKAAVDSSADEVVVFFVPARP